MITLLPAVVLSMVTVLFHPETVWADTAPKPYIGLRPDRIQDPRVPLFDQDTYQGLNMNGAKTPALKMDVPGLKRESKVDSTGRSIQFVEKVDAVDFRLPAYLPLTDYADVREKENQKSLWKRTAMAKLGERSELGGGGGALRIDIPVEIKSKAFQKIFGSGTVGLDVTGDISIKGGLRHEKRSEIKTALNQGNDTNFKMEQTQRFRVQGHIGDKVTIGVDQDSERTFDFENNIKLKYQGFDDEIIQSIEAGNIALSLPGTRYVTFGGQSTGLFGIKTAMTVGNLKVTAIASQEKGEQKRLSLSGGAAEGVKTIRDKDYLKGTYYFIDDHYRKQFSNRGTNGEFIFDPSRTISNIEVYKSKYEYATKVAEAVYGWAWVPAPGDSNVQVMTRVDTTVANQEYYRGSFLRLEKTEYYYDPQLGYLRMKTPLDESSEVLAVAFRDTSGYTRGMIDFNPETQKVIQLRLLKPMSPRPKDSTWDLAWKNVYQLGPAGMSDDGFALRILYRPPSGDPIETSTVGNKKVSYLNIFGLDDVDRNGTPNSPDNLVDRNENVLRLGLGELWFPDLKPFDPVSKRFQDLLPENMRSPALYDTTVESAIIAASKFDIEVTSKTRSADYSLGMNVIENSEEITLNGRRLTRGTDYIIEYMTGALKILNMEATMPSANVEVTYESNQLFQIDKKTVMGARAEYGLWDDSFLGATFLYLNESTLDQKIRVGKGPMRNMVWDVNTKMTLKPFFLTRFANMLPFVDSRQPTTLTFEGEVAQVIPNPNTRNNPATGDKDGVAYIDDFEASKRITPLGISRRSWSLSSLPIVKSNKMEETLSLVNRGKLLWYEPFQQVAIKDIWPNRDINANVAQTTTVLVMQFTPADSIADLSKSWGGLQKGLSSGYFNQTESKFLEIWLKGSEGNLHIDMGKISEDIIPNHRFDTEDEMRNGFRNDLLDEGEDKGIDNMANNDPRAIAAGGDFWDINGNGVRDYGEPYSDDDWSYSSGSADYDRINGLEGNANDYGGRKPDSEDMNGNKSLDETNAYFSYSFSLRRDSPDTTYIAGASIDKQTGEDHGWRLYRIPLDALAPTRSTIGTADMTKIEFIRMWVDGFSTPGPHSVIIADISLVGNEWKELGVATPEDPEKYLSAADSIVTVSVVNTQDNPEYIPPPGVTGEVDRITQVTAKEQALVMNINNLQPGNNGIIQKTFYDKQDYIRYRTLKMFVYGQDQYGRHIGEDSTKIEAFLRFGSDMNNYYEVRQPVYEGWDPRNNMEVDLQELSAIKLIAENYDSTSYRKGFFKDMGNGVTYFIKGIPALTNVRMLVAGVRNMDPKNAFFGQVWLNELRLSNVKKDKGMAYRARVDMDWAGLVRFNGEVEKQDADFHNISTQFGDGDNTMSGNFSTSIQMDKFLPSKLGLSIPVSFNYGRREATPKYKPGTDVEVNSSLPDSIIERIRTVDQKLGYNVSLAVNSRSQNFFVKNLLSNLRASYSENRNDGSSSQLESTNNRTQNADVSWNVNFSPNNYIRPFRWLGKSKWVTKLSEMKLYYSPQSLSSQMTGSRSRNEQLTRSGVLTRNDLFNITSSARGTLKVFESLSFDMDRSYANDLQDIPKDTLKLWLERGRLGYLTQMSQNFKATYNPKLFSWLTNNMSYSAGFRYGFNRQQKMQARNATLAKSIGVNGSFDLNAFFRTIYKAPMGTVQRGGLPVRRPTPQREEPKTPDNKQTGKDQKESGKKKEKTPGGGFSVMGLFGKFFGIFEPVSVSYNTRENVSIYGIGGMPTMGFMMGLSDSIGVPMEKTGSASSSTVNRNSSSQTDNLRLSSGVGISRDIKLSLTFDKNYSINTSTTTTGQRTHSRLVFGDKIDMPFPEWSIRVGSLEKLPLLNKYVQRASFDHSYSGQANETFNTDKGRQIVTKDDRSSQFRPLAGLNLALKNGATLDIRYNMSENISLSKGYGIGGTKNNINDLTITARYSKRSDFRIPIPVWPFKNMKLRNNVDLTITASSSQNVTSKSRGGGKYEVTAETSNWKLRPDLTYSFSDRVRGGMHLEVGKTHNKLVGDSSYTEFGLDVNISIRGN